MFTWAKNYIVSIVVFVIIIGLIVGASLFISNITDHVGPEGWGLFVLLFATIPATDATFKENKEKSE